MAVVLLVANGSWAQPAGMKKVTSVEGITEYALDNGMQVLIFPDPSKPTMF
jgi:zinc protease